MHMFLAALKVGPGIFRVGHARRRGWWDGSARDPAEISVVTFFDGDDQHDHRVVGLHDSLLISTSRSGRVSRPVQRDVFNNYRHSAAATQLMGVCDAIARVQFLMILVDTILHFRYRSTGCTTRQRPTTKIGDTGRVRIEESLRAIRCRSSHGADRGCRPPQFRRDDAFPCDGSRLQNHFHVLTAMFSAAVAFCLISPRSMPPDEVFAGNWIPSEWTTDNLPARVSTRRRWLRGCSTFLHRQRASRVVAVVLSSALVAYRVSRGSASRGAEAFAPW